MSNFTAGSSQGARTEGSAKEQNYFSSVLFAAPQTVAGPQSRRLEGTSSRGRAPELTPASTRRLANGTPMSGLSSVKSAPTPYERDRRIEPRATPSKVPPPTVSIYDGATAIVPFNDFPETRAEVAETFPVGSPLQAARSMDDVQDESDEQRRRINRTVTVFGFTPDKVPVVLNFLDYCGKIEETWMSDKISNGMHVRFESEVSAACAVAKNGQFVDGNVMIGVVKYDPDRFQGRHKAVLRSAQINTRGQGALMPLAAVRESYKVDATQPQAPYRVSDKISSAFDWIFGF